MYYDQIESVNVVEFRKSDDRPTTWLVEVYRKGDNFPFYLTGFNHGDCHYHRGKGWAYAYRLETATKHADYLRKRGTM